MTDLQWIPSPHHYRNRNGHSVDLFVAHYTAGRGEAVATARVFTMRTREASAEFIIGRDGDEVQCVDVDDGAWHAGDHTVDQQHGSRFPTTAQLEVAIAKGTFFVALADVPYVRRDVNLRSVGIEHCNRGWAPRGRNPYATAKHRNPACHSTSWESYSDIQLARSVERVKWLRQHFPGMRWMCGHEDVTNQHTLGQPGGKTDPGPLFPWDAYAGLGLQRVRFDYTRVGWEIVQP